MPVPDGFSRHPRACRCDTCLALCWAVTQQNPDGSPLFTDEQLVEMASLMEEPPNVS